MLLGETHHAAKRQQYRKNHQPVWAAPATTAAATAIDARLKGLACASFGLFVNSGRFSSLAPRQPSAAIYQRIQAALAPRVCRPRSVGAGAQAMAVKKGGGILAG